MSEHDGGELTGPIADATSDPSANTFARLLGALASSAKAAGARAVTTGQWAATTLIEAAPRIPVRDVATLEAQHGGLTGADLASELIRRATRASAIAGAAGGAMVSAGQLAPPAWVVMPFEVVAQTVGVALIELKLIAELHEVYGRAPTGTTSERANAIVRAWAERRGITVAAVATPGGLANALGKGTRDQLIKLVRRRLLVRMGRSTSTLAPLFVGAAAGAEVNRRGTRALGEAVLADLAAGTQPVEGAPAPGKDGGERAKSGPGVEG